jgi:hypothetical protein
MKKTSDVDQFNGNVTKEMAKQATKSTLSTVQDTVQSGVSKAQQALLLRVGARQGLLKGQQKRTTKNLKKVQKKGQKNLKNIQATLRSGVSKTLEVLQMGLGVAQEVLEQNMKRANKNLRKTRKTLKNLQGTLQDNMQSGLSQTQDVLLTGVGTTQDVLGKSAQGAAKGLKKAQENLEDTRASFQTQMKRRASRRRRAKTIFRLGLLSGIVLALFYAPWPGSETRRRLVENWQRLFPSQ